MEWKLHPIGAERRGLFAPTADGVQATASIDDKKLIRYAGASVTNLGKFGG
jgi:hypothetical protein